APRMHLTRPASALAITITITIAIALPVSAASAGEPRVQLTLETGERVARAPLVSNTYANPLTAYGYGPMSFFFEGSIAEAYGVRPVLDVGVRVAYLSGHTV